ncbi:MAG TPA: GGDEF domain-containing protein [Solirubrobacterales bacterium]|nr:GGDEF domain-containing protein [Solirubrobacterales bacterium]
MASHSRTGSGSENGSPAGRIAREVSSLQASLLAKLRQELDGSGPEEFAATAARLATDFGSVTATAVDAAYEQQVDAPAPDEQRELSSLYRPGHMRRRLDQLAETNRRYGHPFALAVFDASGPETRNGSSGQETVLAIVGAALRDSIRIVDEAFRLEEDAICVLAPNLRTVEAVQMAERLLGQLDDLERAGGLRISVAAGVAACPEHGADVEGLLQKADAAMWRARALGQPVGVGALEPVQDR